MYQLSFDFMENYVDEGIILNKLGKFKTKKCIKCQKEYEATIENFSKLANGLHYYCKKCLCLNSSKVRKIRKQNNKCFQCNAERLTNHKNCAYHACYSLVSNQQRLGRFQNLKGEMKKQFVKDLLQKLENQNHKCVITGESIEFGLNISLDHIVSIKQGGTDDLENLQWVTLKANKEKGALN